MEGSISRGEGKYIHICSTSHVDGYAAALESLVTIGMFFVRGFLTVVAGKKHDEIRNQTLTHVLREAATARSAVVSSESSGASIMTLFSMTDRGGCPLAVNVTHPDASMTRT
jgi:hypothetical protein